MDFQLKQEVIQSELFKGKCGGQFNSAEYPYVLREEHRKENLYTDIADSAIKYFKENRIVWWRGKDGLPTNHTLSSQVACLNHLFWIRDNQKAATSVLKQIDKDFVTIKFPNSDLNSENYVEFELNGYDKSQGNLLGEKGSARGANTTSIDAAMLAMKDNKIILIFIEWKYVEHYHRRIDALKAEPKYEVQKKTYKNLLLSDDSPIILDKIRNKLNLDFDLAYQKFSVEPFYQLMRQTLLAWRLSCVKRYGAEDYLHIHVIPKDNKKLLLCKTSPEITEGYSDIRSAWAAQLKNPAKYIHMDPSELIGHAAFEYNKGLYEYLNNRYWR